MGDIQTITIDPSGTGVTCILHDNKFYNIDDKDWLEHYAFIKRFIKNNNITKVQLETVKCIYTSNNHTLSLIKLLGALEILFSDSNLEVVTITSDQTKRIAKWFKNIKYTEFDIDYKKKITSKLLREYEFCKKTQLKYVLYKGWFLKGKKITDHERDTVLIYWILNERWKENETCIN